MIHAAIKQKIGKDHMYIEKYGAYTEDYMVRFCHVLWVFLKKHF